MSLNYKSYLIYYKYSYVIVSILFDDKTTSVRLISFEVRGAERKNYLTLLTNICQFFQIVD